LLDGLSNFLLQSAVEVCQVLAAMPRVKIKGLIERFSERRSELICIGYRWSQLADFRRKNRLAGFLSI
jgi:hypothetical protein